MVKLIFKYLTTKQKMQFIFLVVISVLSSLIGVLTPLLSGQFIDNLLIYKNINVIVKYCSIILSISLIGLFIGYFLQILTVKVTTESAFNMNYQIVEHVKKLPFRFWRDKNVAYLNQRINGDTNVVMGFCFSAASNILINGFTLVFTSVILARSDVKLLLVLVFFLICYPVLYLRLKGRLYKSGLELQESSNTLFSSLNEQLGKSKFIKVHSVNEIYKGQLFESFQKFFVHKLSYQKVSYVYSGSESLISTLAQTGIFVLGGIAVINGNITIGFFTIILSYIKMMIGALKYFLFLGKSYQDANVSYKRIDSILSEAPYPEGSTVLDHIHSIKFHDLQFSYDSNPLFRISMSFERGNAYCISGSNGVGKTTLCELMLGIFPGEYTGEIILNDKVNLKEMNLSAYRKKNIGMTEQEASICDGSIEMNMTLLNTNVESEQLESLIKYLHLQDFIDSQKDGINTRINEEMLNLSGGERQKIAIIRQLLQNPDVMIFDEPTSSLDAISIERFCSLIDTIKEDKIIFIISHDKVIEDCCDFIIRLDQFQ